MQHSFDLVNIAEVSSEEVNEINEIGLLSKPEESENEEDWFIDSSGYASSASESDNIDNDFWLINNACFYYLIMFCFWTFLPF